MCKVQATVDTTRYTVPAYVLATAASTINKIKR